MKRSTWLLLAAVAALVAAIFLWERKQPTTGEREEGKLKVVEIKSSDVVGLARSGEAPIELTKAGEDRWSLVGPIHDVADRYGIEGFLERLGQTRALRFVEPGTPAGSQGLDKPRAAWTIRTGTVSLKIEVGGRALMNEGLYLRVNGRAALVPSDLESVLLKPVDDFRLKNLTSVATQEVKSFDIQAGPGESVAARRDRAAGWLVTVPFEDWGSAPAIEEMLDDLSLCLVESFVPAASDLKTLGLAPPARTIHLQTEKGSPVEIGLGAPVPGSDPAKKLLFASVTGRPSPMTISANGLRFLGKRPEALRSLDVFPQDAFDAQELKVTGRMVLALKRSEKGGWTVEGKPPKGSQDAGGLPAALAALKGEKPLPWQGPGALGFGRAEYTFALKGPGFEQMVEVGAEVAGRRLAHPAGRPVALLLTPDGWATVEAALKLTGGSAGVSATEAGGKAP